MSIDKLDLIQSFSPSYYYDDPIMTNIYEIEASGLDDYDKEEKEIIEQMSPHTASWGLILWERELGIETILSDSYELRRARVLAKFFANPIVTRALMEKIVNLFVPANSAAVETIKNEYAFEINIPITDYADIKKGLKEAVEETKPAHMESLIVANSDNEIFVGHIATYGSYPLPITNTFYTAPTFGKGFENITSLQNKVVGGINPLLFCGAFYTAE